MRPCNSLSPSIFFKLSFEMQTPPCPNARKFQLLPTSSSITSDDVSARLLPWRSREDLRRCPFPAAQPHPHSRRLFVHPLRRLRRRAQAASRRRPRQPPPQRRGTPRRARSGRKTSPGHRSSGRHQVLRLSDDQPWMIGSTARKAAAHPRRVCCPLADKLSRGRITNHRYE